MIQPKENSLRIPRKYNPNKAEDLLSNVNGGGRLGEAVIGMIKIKLRSKNENEIIPQPQGPILSLYAGQASPEQKLFELIPPQEQELVAVDYNPNLKSSDSRIKYQLGDVLHILPTLEAGSFGIITIFGADGSIEEGDWEILWKEIDRVLKLNGYVLIFPKHTTTPPTENFRPIFQSEYGLGVFKVK